MFRLMRNFWATPDAETETKLKRRKGKNRKRKRNKANLSAKLIGNKSVEDHSKDHLESNSEDHLKNNLVHRFENNLIESDELPLISAEDENWTDQNYEVEIDEEQYNYMLEHNYINENNEFINLDLPIKEDDVTTQNILFEVEEERKKKNKNEWWSNDEEFEENFELTDEQKLKCAAFFIWIITLIVFFYFHNPEPKDSSTSSRNDHHSSLDRIRDMTKNRLPSGLLSQRNKIFPGMEDDPAEHLSKYFDRNQRGRSPYDPRFGAYDDQIEDDEHIQMKRKLKGRKNQKTKKDGIKKILWWGDENKMPSIYRNKKIFEYYKCEKTNCEFSNDKTRSRESNAIVFDYQSSLNLSDLPSTRRKMQLYIFYSEDAPQIYENRNELNELKFNLSWSFTLDSSIQLNAGNLVFDQNLLNENLKAQIKKKLSRTKIKDCLVILANACKTIRFTANSSGNLIRPNDELNEIENLNANLNTSTDATNASNANTTNSTSLNNSKSIDEKDKSENVMSLNRLRERLKIVQNLMTSYEQYLLNELIESNDSLIQFDLLTNCSLSNGQLKDLISNYRFVLIIENQMCKNYQTNYVYLALETNAIPILNGNQYGNLPHNSIIDLNKFQKMSHLADYLKGLKLKFSEFYSHLDWKNYFKVSYKKNDICELCEKLNQINYKNYKSLTSVNFTPNMWKLNAACFTFDQF